jgi:hypothetical protein
MGLILCHMLQSEEGIGEGYCDPVTLYLPIKVCKESS